MSRTITIIGIDPGASGGIATLSSDGLSVVPMPWTPRDGVDVDELRSLFILADHVVIEQVQLRGSKAQGVKSLMTMALNWGRIEGAARALFRPVTIVDPRTWQRVMLDGRGKGDRKAIKAASVAVAKRLWPMVDFRPTERCKVESDGMAESALIAEWGRRTLNGAAP